MKERSQSRRSRWFRVAFGVGLVIAAHAFGSGSANAAPIHLSPNQAARIASAATGPARQTTVLAGFTSQQYPAFFKIAAAGRSLTLGAIALNLSCTSGGQVALGDAFTRVPISPNGKLHAAFSIPPTAGSSGETFSGTDTMSARLNRKHTQLAGTWELVVNYSFTNGMSDQCSSGPVRFTATNR
jgi:hypothetical protein